MLTSHTSKRDTIINYVISRKFTCVTQAKSEVKTLGEKVTEYNKYVIIINKINKLIKSFENSSNAKPKTLEKLINELQDDLEERSALETRFINSNIEKEDGVLKIKNEKGVKLAKQKIEKYNHVRSLLLFLSQGLISSKSNYENLNGLEIIKCNLKNFKKEYEAKIADLNFLIKHVNGSGYSMLLSLSNEISKMTTTFKHLSKDAKKEKINQAIIAIINDLSDKEINKIHGFLELQIIDGVHSAFESSFCNLLLDFYQIFYVNTIDVDNSIIVVGQHDENKNIDVDNNIIIVGQHDENKNEIANYEDLKENEDVNELRDQIDISSINLNNQEVIRKPLARNFSIGKVSKELNNKSEGQNRSQIGIGASYRAESLMLSPKENKNPHLLFCKDEKEHKNNNAKFDDDDNNDNDFNYQV